MRIASGASAGFRHATGALVEAALVVAIAAALVFSAALVSRSAPTGAGAVRAATTTASWIALATVDGAKAATVQPSLGDYVTFDSGYPKTIKNPRILVDCYQNGQLVFGMGGAVDYAFLLGGGGSIWLTNGGPADCTAYLYYYGFHAGKQTYNVLASTDFSAGG